MLVEAYGHNAPSESTCRQWFRRFKNHNFEECEGPLKRFEDKDLEVILDEDTYQSEMQLAEALNVTQQCISKRLHRIGMVQKKGNWLPLYLTERAIERRKIMCEILLKRYKKKSFLHRIVTGEEK